MRPAATRPVPAITPVAATAADAARAARDAALALLLQAAAHGDCTAFESFYDRTVAHAEAVARRLLRGADVDDLLGDAYFEAWRQAARFDAARGSALTWLLTLVRSRAIDLRRRQAARPGHDAPPGDAVDAAADQADPIDALWQQQSSRQLHAAMAGLDGTERWLLGLAYFRDCSHSVIARQTGLPVGTVKSVLARAQAKLRKAFGV